MLNPAAWSLAERDFSFLLWWLTILGGIIIIFLAPPLLGSCLSEASHQVNFTQFSFKWLVSLQYQQVNAGSKEPSTPGANWDGCGFSR